MAMNDLGIGASFDPTRPDPGPQGSSPAQALQIIGLHLPKLSGVRGIPSQLTGAPSHVGQTPEALVLQSLLKASQTAGTNGFGSDPNQPTGGVHDLLKLIESALGPTSGDPNAPAPPTPQPSQPTMPGPNYGAPHVTPTFPVMAGNGLRYGATGGQYQPGSRPMDSGGPTFGIK